MAASATPPCAARADNVPTMSAPLVLPFDAIPLPAVLVPEGDPELEAVDGKATAGDWVGTAGEDEAGAEVAAVPFELPPGR